MQQSCSRLLQSVEGTTEPQVERIDGLPQITIQYDRAKLPGYGLNIEDINHIISTAFAGEVAGVVYENERKFDLVVRLDSAHRTSIDDVSQFIYSNYQMVTRFRYHRWQLFHLKKVLHKSAGKMANEECVGFNVKDRDVQTVVKEIQEKLNDSVKLLPDGYYYTYGGTFENLQESICQVNDCCTSCTLLDIFFALFHFRFIKEATADFYCYSDECNWWCICFADAGNAIQYFGRRWFYCLIWCSGIKWNCIDQHL